MMEKASEEGGLRPLLYLNEAADRRGLSQAATTTLGRKR